MNIIHSEYSILAARIAVSNLHKETNDCFIETMKQLKENNILSEIVYNIMIKHKQIIEQTINYQRDYTYDFFGFKTLTKSYLLKVNNQIVERPQDMIMRVSFGIHYDDIQSIIETYNYMSLKYFTHATPTLFNSGTIHNQLSSCFLLNIKEDSIEGIFDTLKQCALISKTAGGIGLSIHDVRSKNSQIKGTNGISNGIVPMLKVFNETARYVDQCFTKDTLIYTEDGIKNINLIQINDKVLTQDGNFNNVLKVLQYNKKININQQLDDEKLYEIQTLFSQQVQIVTSMHPFYCIQNIDNNYDDLLIKLQKNIIQSSYINVCYINMNDYIGYPIPIYNDKLDILELDNEDCLMYGLLLRSRIKIQNNQINIIIRQNNKQIKFNQLMTNKYNEYQLKRLKNNNYKYIYNLNQFNLYKLNLIQIKKNKIQFNQKLLHLPENKIIQIIKGTSYQFIYPFKKKNKLYQSSNKLNLECIKYLLLRLKIQVEIKQYDKFSQINQLDKSFIFDNIMYYKIKQIKQIEQIKQKEEVIQLYDLEIDINHNYMTDSGLCHNGGGKRRGSIAVYIEPWHADIEEFLQLKKNNGKDEMRARDLFYALWICDLFMERVENNQEWSLMCPNICNNLSNLYGNQFNKQYIWNENNGKYVKKVQARELFTKIIESQIETGTPYMLYKDASNMKSNQQNLGTIKSSNLCVSPDTQILTEDGYYKMKNLEGKQVNVWNGFELSNTTIFKTGSSQYLQKIKFSNGQSILCTSYHKFYINNQQQFIEAKNLKKGMIINDHKLPYITNLYKQNIIQNAYLQGLLNSHSFRKKLDVMNFQFININNNLYIQINIDKYIFNKIKNYILQYKIIQNNQNNLIYTCIIKNKLNDDLNSNLDSNLNSELQLQEKMCYNLDYNNINKYVPINENIYVKINYLEGVYDICGYIHKNIFNINNDDKKLLLNLQLLLHTIGIQSIVKKLFNNIYVLKIIYSKSLLNLGFNIRMNINDIIIDQKYQNKIIDIYYNYKIDDTYCMTEELRGTGIFNGILTGNCSEIIQYSSPTEIAVCNLASISLPQFVQKDLTFNYQKLIEITKVITRNLNKIIDINYYPLEETRNSNLKHRPIGIGIQGLADTFIKMRLEYESEEANQLNKNIFETIYFAACSESNELSKIQGPYSSFYNSPSSGGKLQFDFWNNYKQNNELNYDWNNLKQNIIKYGLRNSLLTALMPTASTSQILGNTESFEAITSNLYVRRVLSGEFICINKYLITDLINLGIWDSEMRNQLIANNGSIQQINRIPDNIKKLYKTVWEISQKKVVDMSITRAPFIDQSQSLNIFIAEPTINKLQALHFHTWKNGLKTGMYYLRSKPAVDTIKFTVDVELLNNSKNLNKYQCIGDENCISCSG